MDEDVHGATPITLMQGYLAMHLFLQTYWEKTGRSSNDIAALLGGMALNQADGQPMDPAFWQEWRKAVAIACGAGLTNA